jgi:hypothetical protein
MTNRHGAGTNRPPRPGWRDRITGVSGLSIHPSSRESVPCTVSRTGPHGRFITSADLPPKMPAPETKKSEKSSVANIHEGADGVGGARGLGWSERKSEESLRRGGTQANHTRPSRGKNA